MTHNRTIGAAFAVASLLSVSAAYASDQTDLLREAAHTAADMRHDPAFGPARDMIGRARGVLIVPHLVKGGFIIGAEGGNGVLMEHRGKGWSEPAFYTLGSASFGLQAGLEDAKIAMLIMSDRALHAIEDGNFKLGAGGGITVVTLSGGAEAATPANLAGDIIVWTSAKGVYGGITINGSVVTPKNDWDREFYGHDASVRDILANDIKNPAALPLRQELDSVR